MGHAVVAQVRAPRAASAAVGVRPIVHNRDQPKGFRVSLAGDKAQDLRAKCTRRTAQVTAARHSANCVRAELSKSSTMHFLHLDDYTKEELFSLLKRAEETKTLLRSTDKSYTPLKGKTMAMIFAKPSMRTRVSFETVRIPN
eukprot:2708015-Pyramimonas_sp.AAC.1